MGVAGAAVATIASQGISGLLCLVYMVKKVPLLALHKEHLRLDPWCVRNQVSIGIPMALQFSITAVGTIMVQVALNMLGSTVVAAYTAACKVEQLVTQVFASMGMTMATFCGQNRGINDLGRIKKGSRIAFWMSAVYGVIIYAVVVVALPVIIRLFVTGDSTEVLGYARTYILINGAFFIPLGMIFIYRNVMQSCGYALMPMMGRRGGAFEQGRAGRGGGEAAELCGRVRRKCQRMVPGRNFPVHCLSVYHEEDGEGEAVCRGAAAGGFLIIASFN